MSNAVAGAENRLMSVVEHWLPRIEVAGIPSATAKAIIERAGVWENWLACWCEEGEVHAAMARDAAELGRNFSAGEAYARASLFYHFAQFMAFDDLGAKARAAARKVELFRLSAPRLDPPGEIIDIPFEKGILRAHLRLPRGTGPHPLVLIIPGSDSTKEEFPALESHFLARGIATFSLDGPGQGEGRSHGPLRPDIGPAITAARQALAGHRALSGRMALLGMAFGGFLALRAAAGQPDLAGIVSLNGFHDLGALWPQLPQVYRDNMTFALGGGDVPAKARSFTLVGAHTPDVPALIIHGGRDKIFPPGEAEACGTFCGAGAELHILPTGNHVCNNIPFVYRPLAADWLMERFSTRMS